MKHHPTGLGWWEEYELTDAIQRGNSMWECKECHNQLEVTRQYLQFMTQRCKAEFSGSPKGMKLKMDCPKCGHGEHDFRGVKE